MTTETVTVQAAEETAIAVETVEADALHPIATPAAQHRAERAATDLVAEAESLGLYVAAVAGWPETADEASPPMLPAFVVSDFSPMIALVATRCLERARLEGAHAEETVTATRTAIVVMSPLGDIISADHVAQAVDHGDRVGPLLFFQAVPNAVAGLIAARWGLAGPMVSLGAAEGGLDVAALLIEDGDATDALVVLAESDPDRAVALLVEARDKGEL